MEDVPEASMAHSASDHAGAPSARSAATSTSAAESTESIAAVRPANEGNSSKSASSSGAVNEHEPANKSGSGSNAEAQEEQQQEEQEEGGEEGEEGEEADDDDESHMSHCNKCKQGEEGDELLLCEACPRAFHLSCLGYGAVPDVTWYCDACLAKQKRSAEKAAAKEAVRVAREAARVEEKERKAKEKEAAKLAKEVEKRKKALEKEAKEAAKGKGKKRKAADVEQGEEGEEGEEDSDASTVEDGQAEAKSQPKGKTPKKEPPSSASKGKSKGEDSGQPPKAKKSKVGGAVGVPPAREGQAGEGSSATPAAPGKAGKAKSGKKDAAVASADQPAPAPATTSGGGGGLLSTLAGKVGSTAAKGLTGLHAPSPRAAERAVGPASSTGSAGSSLAVPSAAGAGSSAATNGSGSAAPPSQAIAALLAQRAFAAAERSTVTPEQKQELENLINAARSGKMQQASGLGVLGKPPHPATLLGHAGGAGGEGGSGQEQQVHIEPEIQASVPLGLAISMFISSQKQADAEAAQKAQAIEQALAAQTAAAAGGAAPAPQPLEHKPREVASLYARSRTVENNWSELVKKAAQCAAVQQASSGSSGGQGASQGASGDSEEMQVLSVEGPALPAPLPGLEQKALMDVSCPVYAGHGHYSVSKSCGSITACLGKVDWSNVTLAVLPVELRAFGLAPAYRGEPAAQPSVRQALAASLAEQDARAAAAAAKAGAAGGALQQQQAHQAAQRAIPREGLPDEEVLDLPLPPARSPTAAAAATGGASEGGPATPIPTEPSFTRDTLGLPDSMLGDVLPLWDFIRTFTRTHAAGVPPVLRTGPLETGEALVTTERWFNTPTLAPEVEAVTKELGLTGKAPPLPCPELAAIPGGVAADLADQQGSSTAAGADALLPELSVDPATLSLPDLLLALSSPSFRAYRLLSRVHVAMLKFLLRDRDTTLEHQRGGAAGGGAGAGEHDEEEEGAGGGGKAQSNKIGRTSRTLQDEIGASYEARLGDREREQDPLLGQLNVLTWPEVLRRTFCYGPLSAYLRPHLTARTLAIVDTLTHLPYASLCMGDRLALLSGLMDAVTATDSFGNYCNEVVGERVHALHLELEEDTKRLTEDREADIGRERAKAQVKIRYYKDVLEANQQAKVKQIAAAAVKKMAAAGEGGAGSKQAAGAAGSAPALTSSSSSSDQLASILSASTPEEDSLDEGTWSEVVTARLEEAGLSRVEVRTQLAQALKHRNTRLAQEKDATAKKAAVADLAAAMAGGDIAALGQVLRRVTQSGLGLEGKLPPSALPDRPAKGRPPKAKEEGAAAAQQAAALPVGMDDTYAQAQILHLTMTSKQRVQQLTESYEQRIQSVRTRFNSKVDNMRLSAILLGSDRFHRTYWVLNGDRGWVWVECPVDTSGRPLAGAPPVSSASGHGAPSQGAVQEARLDLRSCGLDAGLALASAAGRGGTGAAVGAGMGDSAMEGSDSPAAFGAGAGGTSLTALQAGRTVTEPEGGSGAGGAEASGAQASAAQGAAGGAGGKKKMGRVPYDVEAHRTRVASEYNKTQLQASCLLAVHAPEGEQSRWLCLDSLEQMTSLLQWLDPRGSKEMELSKKLQRYIPMFQAHMPPTHAVAAYLRASRTALLRAHPALQAAVTSALHKKEELRLEDAERQKQQEEASAAAGEEAPQGQGQPAVPDTTATAATAASSSEGKAEGEGVGAMEVEHGEGGADENVENSIAKAPAQATLDAFFPSSSSSAEAVRPKRAAASLAAARVFATSSLGVAHSRAAAGSSSSSSSSSGTPGEEGAALPLLTPLQQARQQLEEVRTAAVAFEAEKQGAADPAAKGKGKKGGARGSRELSNLAGYGVPSKAQAASHAANKRAREREAAEAAARPVDAAPATAVLLQACKRQLLELESKLERGVVAADSKHVKVQGGCGWYRPGQRGLREAWREAVGRADSAVNISSCVLQLEDALFGLQRIRRERLGLVKKRKGEGESSAASPGHAGTGGPQLTAIADTTTAAALDGAEGEQDAPSSSPTAEAPPAPSSAARAARGGARGRGVEDEEDEEAEEVEEEEQEGEAEEEGNDVVESGHPSGLPSSSSSAAAAAAAPASSPAGPPAPASSTTTATSSDAPPPGREAAGTKAAAVSKGGKGKKKGWSSGLEGGLPVVSAPKLKPFNSAHEYGWSDAEDAELPVLHAPAHPPATQGGAHARPSSSSSHPILAPPTFTTAGRPGSQPPEDAHTFDELGTSAMARDRHGAWARLKAELVGMGVQPDRLVTTLWSGRVDQEREGGAAVHAGPPAPLHYNGAAPYARAVRPEAYCDPVTGVPVEPLSRILQGAKAGPTLLSPVFPWAPAGVASAGGSTEAGVEGEVAEAVTLQVGLAHVREQNKGMLWSHRSSRRWWRLRVRWCTSLHAACLLLVELQEVAAGAGLCDHPVTLLSQAGGLDGGEGGEGGEVVELDSSSSDEERGGEGEGEEGGGAGAGLDEEEEEGGAPAARRGGKKQAARDDSDSFAQGEATDTEDEGGESSHPAHGHGGAGKGGGRGGGGGKGGRQGGAAKDEELSVTEDEEADEEGAPRRAGSKSGRSGPSAAAGKTSAAGLGGGKRKAHLMAAQDRDAMDDERDSEADEEDDQAEAAVEAEEDDHEDNCIACGGGSAEGDASTDPLLMCEGCSTVCHLTCAGERKVPRGNWFCSDCKAKPCLTCGKPVESAKAAHCGIDSRTARQRGAGGGAGKGGHKQKKARTGEGAAGGGCGAIYHCTCVFLKEPPAQSDWLCPRCSKKY